MNRPHTPVSRLAAAALRLAGWQILLAPPPGPKIVAVAAPHTSNADFWPGIFWRWATRSPARWIGKHSLFRPPVGWVLRWWGGIPVDRRRSGGNFVDAVVEIIQASDEIMLTIAPEGTRTRTEHWKTGFYYMALEAGVPIGVTVMDWGRKRFGLVGYVQPTGDIEADFAALRELLRGVQGHTPENTSPVIPSPASGGSQRQN